MTTGKCHVVGRRQLNSVLFPLWLSSCYGRLVLKFSGLNFLGSRMGAMPSHMVILQIKYVVIEIPHPYPISAGSNPGAQTRSELAALLLQPMSGRIL